MGLTKINQIEANFSMFEKPTNGSLQRGIFFSFITN